VTWGAGLRQVLRQADARVTLVVAVVGALLGVVITDRPLLWAVVWTVFGIVAVGALALASQPEQGRDAETGVNPQTLRTMELRDAVSRASRARACHTSVLRGVRNDSRAERRARLQRLADAMAVTVHDVYDVCCSLERALDSAGSHVSESSGLITANGGSNEAARIEAWRVINSAVSDLELASQKATAARSSGGFTEGALRPLELELQSRSAQLDEIEAALLPYDGEHDRSHALAGS
jgi:hypothetical protein